MLKCYIQQESLVVVQWVRQVYCAAHLLCIGLAVCKRCGKRVD